SEPCLLEFVNDFFRTYSGQFEPMQPRQQVDDRKMAARFISAPTSKEEDEGILTYIQTLLERGARFDDICILGRTHAHLSEIGAVLKGHGIPVQIHSPKGFWKRREVLAATALLKFLVNPHDNLTLLSLLRSPGFKVDDEKLIQFMESRPKSLWHSLNHCE